MTAPRPMPPLFAPALVPRGSPQAAVLTRLEPFWRHGVLEGIDLHTAAHLARMASAMDPDLVLALALAVRAPRRGHVCVDLDTLEPKALLPVQPDEDAAESKPTPELDLPGVGWAARVAGFTALVRSADDPDRPTPFVLAGTTLYTDRYWRYQQSLADRITGWLGSAGRLRPADPDLLCRGLGQLFPKPSGGTIDLQQVAAAMALAQRFTVITGGPGMGKTWTVRNLLALVWLEHRARHAAGLAETPEPVVALAAPTGKAAARMRESLHADLDALLPPMTSLLGDATQAARACEFLRELSASTLHRLLGWRHDNPTRFRRSAADPIPADIVVVDEASMVDVALMAKLFDAVGDRGPGGAPTRLVLLGDRNQLASVEAGTVLADLCGPTRADTLCLSAQLIDHLDSTFELGLRARAEIPGSDVRAVLSPPMHDAVVQLRVSRRFRADSGIGHFALACVGSDFDAKRAADVLDGGAVDVSLLPHAPPPGLDPVVRRLLTDGFTPYLRLLRGGLGAVQGPAFPTQAVFHRRVIEAFDRFRVLCAHRLGSTGASGINRTVIASLSDAGLLDSSEPWWLGRPVLVLNNDYSVRRSSGERGLFNGDIGLLVQARVGGTHRPMVAFPGPDSLPGAQDPCQPPNIEPEQYEDKLLVDYVDPARLPDHATAFAMTIHKSQGSEFHHVCVVLPRQPSSLLTRELVYTGVTRARERMSLVAARPVLEGALSATVQRASGLAGSLWGASSLASLSQSSTMRSCPSGQMPRV